MTDTTAADNKPQADDKPQADNKPSKKVAYPERADDGCTHCGAILTVHNKDGSLDFAASENAQRAHQTNTGCPATPDAEYRDYGETNKGS